MPDSTSLHHIPYPREDERPDVPEDMKNLAERVDDIMKQHFVGNGPPPSVGDTTSAGQHVAALRHGDVYYQFIQ